MSDTSYIHNMLDRLADMRAAVDVINLHYDELRDQILTPEIRAHLEEIEAERKTTIDAAATGMADLEGEIKAAIIAEGASVKAAHLHAVYSAPRVTWDTKKLDGYAAAHPEVLAFRKTGAPSVSIRNV